MPALPQGTGFTNINKIIQANQNNQLGNTIQGGVQKGIQGLQSNINQSQNQFNTDVNNANLNTTQNQQFVQNTIGSIANVNPASQSNTAAPQAQSAPQQVTSSANVPAPNPTSTPGTVNAFSTSAQPSSNPAQATQTSQSQASQAQQQPSQSSGQSGSNVNTLPGSFGLSTPNSGGTATTETGQGFSVPSAGDLSKIQNFAQGSYSGPNQLNNYGALQSQAQNLQNQGQNIGSQGGLQSLLQQYVGGPNYTQGQQTLDTVLLGQTGQPQLQNIARSLQNISQQPVNAEAQAQALAQQTAAGNQAFAQNIQNEVAGAETPILQAIQNNINTLNSQNQAYQSAGQQIYNYLNNPLAKPPSPLVHIGQQLQPGQILPPTTSGQAAADALQVAANNGMITADQLNTLTPLLKQAQTGGTNLQSLLAKAFNFVPNSALPQYTLQQGASAQQAAQLNALNQLVGANPVFNTYGGLTLPQYSFDMSQIPGYKAPAGGSALSGNDRGGFVYNLANTLATPALTAVGAVGTGLQGVGSTLGNLAQGNALGAASSAAATPSNVVNNVTGNLNGGIQSVGNLAGDLTGKAPIVSNAIGATVPLAEIPLNAVNSSLGGLTGGVTGALGNLQQGNVGGAIGSAISGLENSIVAPLQSIGGGVGGAIHSIFCFVEDTPILMESGEYKKVQDIELFDRTKFGGAVTACGVALCDSVVEYKGNITSSSHAIFDGEKFVRAYDLGAVVKLSIPVKVYPIVNENHVLITMSNVLYTDMAEVEATSGLSDEEKLRLLNTPESIERARILAREIDGHNRV